MAIINGNGGDNTLRGTAADDTISGRGGSDRLYGNDGNDLLDGGSGADRLYGGIGDDELLGGDGNDRLYGEDGNDLLSGGLGTDELEGGNGDDLLYGEDGNDKLRGGAGNDVLEGGDTGNDELQGEAGNDTLVGGNGDILRGGTNDDYYILQGAGATITELSGEGIDTVRAFGSMTLGLNIENVEVAGDTTVRGNNLDNFMRSHSQGRDVHLDGRGGNDTLIGSRWAPDILTGSTGNDAFYFTGIHSDEGWDLVTDFAAGADRLAFEFTSRGLALGQIDEDMFHSAFGAGAVAQTAAHRFIFNESSGVLYYDHDGSGSAYGLSALMSVNVVSGALDFSDIYIVADLPDLGLG